MPPTLTQPRTADIFRQRLDEKLKIGRSLLRYFNPPNPTEQHHSSSIATSQLRRVEGCRPEIVPS